MKHLFDQIPMRRLWRHVGVTLIAALPAGGFLFGLLRGGDPDPNPIGRIVYGCMMAVATPLNAGFPPHYEAGPGKAANVWPYIAISSIIIFGWLIFRDRKSSQKANGPKD
jgi:hypothetical protein